MRSTVGSPRLQGVPKQLEYSSKICDQSACRLKTKPIGVESCMAQVCLILCLNNVVVAIFKLLLKTT